MEFAYADKNPVVVIDAGHGGADPGTTANPEFKEKDIVLNYSLYMLKRLKELSVPCAITRMTDKDISAKDRSRMVKDSGAKLCISNHINAAGDPLARGVEVIHSIHNIGKIAKIVYDNLIQVNVGRRVFSRATDSGKDYYFMHRLTGDVTCLIVEYGFASNKEDSKVILERKVDLVEAVLKGICDALGFSYSPPYQSTPTVNSGLSTAILSEALDFLVRQNVIASKDYWMNNALPGKTCSGDHVQILIRQAAEKLGFKETKQPEPLDYELIATTHVARTDPLNVRPKITNYPIDDVKEANAVNGPFFWYTDYTKKQTYVNAILVHDGKILSSAATHAEKSDRSCPQSVLIVYKDGSVDVKRVKYAADLPNLADISFAVGGLGIVTPYGYSPVSEGFYGAYADVLRSTTKTVIGYKKSENKIYVIVRPESTHDRIIQSCKNLGLDIAVSLDGGGSSSLKVANKYKMLGDGRKIACFILW